MRKPVQITLCESGAMAICDDGSIWGYDENHVWTRLPDIPQDEPEQERQSYVRMSADEVGVLLKIAVAARRVVAKYDAGEPPVNVEILRARLLALGQDWIEAQGGLEQPVTSPDVVAALRELLSAEVGFRNTYRDVGGKSILIIPAWNAMGEAEDAAREVLKRIDGQEEPR